MKVLLGCECSEKIVSKKSPCSLVCENCKKDMKILGVKRETPFLIKEKK
jgi:hypothetical protein